MAHKPYHLVRRSTKKPGKYIYYVKFYDEAGNRLTARSSGQTSRAAAEAWAVEQIRRGLVFHSQHITFEQFAENWWIWGKCPYIQGRILRGARISRGYADAMRTYLTQHILPYFGPKKLHTITPKMIEAWILKLKDKQSSRGTPLSHTTVNHVLTCLKIMLKEAVRLDYIQKSPAAPVKQLAEHHKGKSILTADEVRELFSADNIDRVWGGDMRHYTLNLLAASTGMRMGELQGLPRLCIHDKHVEVLYTWDRKYGLKKGPKWSSERQIPIPTKTSAALAELMSLSPFDEPMDLVFFGRDRHTPIHNKPILDTLYKAFENIGIPPEEREKRNVTFHSWRYFYNSLMRGKIHDSKLRQITGHKTLAMTDHYTAFNLESFSDVLRISEQYFS